MLTPANFAPYIGFTEDEVIALCEQYTMDFDGLRTAIIQMLSGAAVEVDINTFQNDMISFQNKDDVITLLIHLGYLAYDQKYRKAFIPNEEIRQEFVLATKSKNWNELLDFQRESKELLEATLDMDCDTVAEKIEKIHTQFASTIQYNDENSLSSVLTIAYLLAMQYYFMPVRGFPTGRGFADYVFLPKPEYAEEMPALLVELKWNKKATAAIQQIKEKTMCRQCPTIRELFCWWVLHMIRKPRCMSVRLRK